MFALVLVCLGTPAAMAQNYGYRIVTPPSMRDRLEATVADARQTLEKITGHEFVVTAKQPGKADDQPGIILTLAQADGVPASIRQQLADADFEAFVLRSSGDGRLWIVANHDLGLGHGLYYYLEQLGCRWYFPHPHWTIIPDKRDITLTIDQRVDPAMTVRRFAPNGGYGARLPTNQTKLVENRWETWKRRNRWGQQRSYPVHVWRRFISSHKEAFEKHPEYYATVDGKRRDTKLNVSNDQMMALFDQWAQMQVRREQTQIDNGAPLLVPTAIVEPSDGVGYCTCAACQKIGNGSPSDQVFHAANSAARAVRQVDPRAEVALYAYLKHAPLPSFPLEPNVRVWVIPYSFNKLMNSPAGIIRDWSEKSHLPLGIYDYWSITQWVKCRPKFDFVRTPAQRIRLWHELGVRGALLETTASSGAIGLGLYQASKLMWNPDTDVHRLLDEFYEECFGPAAAPMKRMLEGWADDYTDTPNMLAHAFRDLHEARKLAAGHPAIMARLDDYTGYVQYLRLWCEFKQAPENTEQQYQAACELIRLMVRIHNTSMVHTFTTRRRISGITRETDYHDKIRAYLNPRTQRDSPLWKELQAPTTQQCAQWVNAGIEDYQPLNIERRSFSDELVPIDPEIRPTGEFSKFNRWLWSTVHEMQVEALPGVNVLPVKVSSVYGLEGDQVRVMLNNPAGKRVYDQVIDISNHTLQNDNPELLRLPMEQPGRYTLEMIGQCQYRFAAPVGIPLTISSMDSLNPPQAYFYVPQGTRQVQMRWVHDTQRLKIFNPAGEKIPYERQAGSLVTVPVPPGMDGKVWSFHKRLGGKVTLLNVPQVLSWFPDTLMIPADAVSHESSK